MSLLAPDVPYGNPAFGLSDDQIATVVDIICKGVDVARPNVTPGMHEVPITRIVRKEARRVKKTLGLTNLEIYGEHEIDNMATHDSSVLGRIDIVMQFLHQFGEEDAYVAVECKRVRPGDSTLNGRYVSQGVDRFLTGKYAAGHERGFMLGYMLALPVRDVVNFIDRRIRKQYGESAALRPTRAHPHSLAILKNTLVQSGNHQIQLEHVFVDMLPADPVQKTVKSPP